MTAYFEIHICSPFINISLSHSMLYNPDGWKNIVVWPKIHSLESLELEMCVNPVWQFVVLIQGDNLLALDMAFLLCITNALVAAFLVQSAVIVCWWVSSCVQLITL
jgi:hypothetical protein